MNIIDTHAHLTWDSFKIDFKEVLKRAYRVDVKTVINVGPDLKRSQEVVSLNCSPLKSYATIGVHPHESLRLSASRRIAQGKQLIQESIDKLEEIYKSNPEKAIAIGECGLDYFSQTTIIDERVKNSQKKLFIAQINLAKKLNLPLIIHCRDSWDDIFLPELSRTTGVFHSFTGNSEQAKKVLDLGYYLGFTCIITYSKNEHLREIIKETPLDKILTETDCPFLPPKTKRGERSEPADVIEVVKIIAQMKNLSFEKIAEATFENAVKLFKLV